MPKRFVVRLSGADAGTLEECSPHVAGIHARLGVLVLIPAALAMVAGTYTVHVLSDGHSVSLALVSGFFWGLAILAIDVAIMSQLRRDPVPEGSKRNWEGVLLFFTRLIMRLFMALILGLVVSETLVMGIFAHRITREIESVREREIRELAENHRKERNHLLKEKPNPPQEPDFDLGSPGTTGPGNGSAENALEESAQVAAKRRDVEATKSEITKLTRERAQRIRDALEFERRAAAEVLGNESGRPGKGDLYHSLKREAAQSSQDAEKIGRNISELETQLKTIKEELARLLTADAKARDRDADTRRRKESADRERNARIAEKREEFERSKYMAAQKRYDDALQAYRKDSEGFERRLARLEKAQETEMTEQKTEPRSDLLYRAEYLNRLTDANRALRWWTWRLLAAIVIVDTIPVLIKALKPTDEYDCRVYVKEKIACNELMKEL